MKLAAADMFPSATIAHDLRFMSEMDRLLARRDAIGSSDVAAVLDNSKYDTPLTLWEDKTGRTSIDTNSSEAAEWGHTLEPVIAQKFAERFEAELFDAPFILRSDLTQWHCASPDFVVISKAGRIELVECKNRRNPWDEGPPQDIVDQCVWQMHVTGIDKCHIVVLFSGNELKVYSIMADPKRAEFLARKVDEFWSFVKFDEPPPPVADDTRHLIPRRGQMLLPEPLIDNLRAAASVKVRISELEAERKALCDPVRVAMADHEEAVDMSGEIVATFKRNTKARPFLPKVEAA